MKKYTTNNALKEAELHLKQASEFLKNYSVSNIVKLNMNKDYSFTIENLKLYQQIATEYQNKLKVSLYLLNMTTEEHNKTPKIIISLNSTQKEIDSFIVWVDQALKDAKKHQKNNSSTRQTSAAPQAQPQLEVQAEREDETDSIDEQRMACETALKNLKSFYEENSLSIYTDAKARDDFITLADQFCSLFSKYKDSWQACEVSSLSSAYITSINGFVPELAMGFNSLKLEVEMAKLAKRNTVNEKSLIEALRSNENKLEPLTITPKETAVEVTALKTPVQDIAISNNESQSNENSNKHSNLLLELEKIIAIKSDLDQEYNSIKQDIQKLLRDPRFIANKKESQSAEYKSSQPEFKKDEANTKIEPTKPEQVNIQNANQPQSSKNIPSQPEYEIPAKRENSHEYPSCVRKASPQSDLETPVKTGSSNFFIPQLIKDSKKTYQGKKIPLVALVPEKDFEVLEEQKANYIFSL